MFLWSLQTAPGTAFCGYTPIEFISHHLFTEVFIWSEVYTDCAEHKTSVLNLFVQGFAWLLRSFMWKVFWFLINYHHRYVVLLTKFVTSGQLLTGSLSMSVDEMFRFISPMSAMFFPTVLIYWKNEAPAGYNIKFQQIARTSKTSKAHSELLISRWRINLTVRYSRLRETTVNVSIESNWERFLDMSSTMKLCWLLPSDSSSHSSTARKANSCYLASWHSRLYKMSFLESVSWPINLSK